MKKVLFWILSPVLLVVFLLGLILQCVGELLEEVCHKFEGWSFNYGEDHTYLGNGIWWTKD